MSDPDQEEMRRKRLARLSAMGADKEKQEVVAATSPTSTSLVTTPLAPVQKMEVDPVPSSGLKARSQVSLDFDSGIENMELEECKWVEQLLRTYRVSQKNVW